MSLTFKPLLAATAAAFAIAGSASAATVTMTATADLSLGNITSTSIEAGDYFSQADALPLTTPVDVAVGDTFVVDIDFLGDQTLTITDLSVAWPLVITTNYGQPSSIDMTGTLELLALNGSVVASASKSDSNSAIHIAQFFSGSDFGSPALLTFAGFRYTGVVDAYDGVLTTRSYNGPSLWFQGSSLQLNGGGAVPEPGTWALMILGFGAAGAMLRRRAAFAGA